MTRRRLAAVCLALGGPLVVFLVVEIVFESSEPSRARGPGTPPAVGRSTVQAPRLTATRVGGAPPSIAGVPVQGRRGQPARSDGSTSDGSPAAPKPVSLEVRRARAENALHGFVKGLSSGAGSDAVRSAEARVRRALEALPPTSVVALLVKADAPAAWDLLRRWIDVRLETDRPRWEDALFLGLEALDRDAVALARLAEFASTRLERPEVRAAAAGFLQKRAETPRLLAVYEVLSRP